MSFRKADVISKILSILILIFAAVIGLIAIFLISRMILVPIQVIAGWVTSAPEIIFVFLALLGLLMAKRTLKQLK